MRQTVQILAWAKHNLVVKNWQVTTTILCQAVFWADIAYWTLHSVKSDNATIWHKILLYNECNF